MHMLQRIIIFGKNLCFHTQDTASHRYVIKLSKLVEKSESYTINICDNLLHKQPLLNGEETVGHQKTALFISVEI